MSIVFSTTTVLLSTLLLSNVVEARCYYDRYGYRRCSGLNNGARVGIAIAAAVVFVLLILSMFGLRRRRIRHANLVYTQNQPVAMEQGNGQPPNMQSYPSQQYQQQQQPQGYQQNYYTPPQQASGPAPVGQYNPTTQQYDGVTPPPPSYQGGNNNSTYAAPSGPPPGQDYSNMTSEQREQAQHDEMMRSQGTTTYAAPSGPPPK